LFEGPHAQCDQQPLRITEMMRWGGVADPDSSSDPAQRKALHPATRQFRLSGVDQRAAQVAVMVGITLLFR
jgi:hypothetical protein